MYESELLQHILKKRNFTGSKRMIIDGLLYLGSGVQGTKQRYELNDSSEKIRALPEDKKGKRNRRNDYPHRSNQFTPQKGSAKGAKGNLSLNI